MSKSPYLDSLTARYEAICSVLLLNDDTVVVATVSDAADEYKKLVKAFNELGELFEATLAEVANDKRLISVLTDSLAMALRQCEPVKSWAFTTPSSKVERPDGQ